MKFLLPVLIALSLPSFSATVLANSSGTVPQVHVQTNMGTFTVELYPKKAPKTVANFLQYARDGFYDGMIFHRLINNYIVQGGAYTQDLQKKQPIYQAIRNEAGNGLSNLRGTIAMAREADPHSATSQFFINLSDNNSLDFRTRTRRGWGYAVFGRVVAGEDILRAFDNGKIKPQGAFKYMPTKPIVIQSMTVDESAVATPKLPVVSKAEEDMAKEGTDVDAADDVDYTEDEAIDAADSADDDYVDDAGDENYAEEEAEMIADAEADAAEEERLTTAATASAHNTSSAPKATGKSSAAPKNLVQPGKSRVETAAKHLPEPPDMPAVP